MFKYILRISESGKVEELESSVLSLQTELNNLKNTAASTLADLESKKAEIGGLEAQLLEQEQEKEAMRAEVAAALAANTTSTALELENLRSTISELQVEKSTVDCNLKALSLQLADMTAERDSVLDTPQVEVEVLKQTTAERDVIQSQLAVQQETVKTLTSSVSDAETRISEAEARVQSYKDMVAEMTSKCDQVDSLSGKSGSGWFVFCVMFKVSNSAVAEGIWSYSSPVYL